MKKVHQAKQVGKNKWVKKTHWKLDVDDIFGFLITACVLGFVLIRVILG